MRATRAIIHLNHFRHNLRLIKSSILPGIKICAAVKADAYGHGAIPLSRAAVEEGVHALAVATTDEALQLRENGFTCPILLLTLPIPEEYEILVKNNFSLLLSSKERMQEIERVAGSLGQKAAIHLDIDTGMNRIGCMVSEAVELAKFISTSQNLFLEGSSTHFAESEVYNSPFTEEQISLFNKSIKAIKEAGIDPGVVHAANSGAILLHPQAHYDMVRPGILLYGYSPAAASEWALPFKPVMELVSRIVLIKELEAETSVSYGRTYFTRNKTRIATISVGYGDGYNRLLSNKASVLIKNKLFPLAGRVCMDQIMVDIGREDDISVGDTVVLFGPCLKGPSAWDLAGLASTIPYEITCNINKRVPRIYLDGDEAG